jgi:glycosyltransferase involved in cell wall biosynthesis
VKVGFYSPLPPARTGVADYSAALLKALERRGSIRVNEPHGDIRLYHLGNNQLHHRIYETALKQPGVVVLHDAVLQHFFLGGLTEREYIAEFCHNYSDWAEDLARTLWRERARSASDPRYFEYPMLKRIAETSLGVIVHNPAAAAMVRAHHPSASVFEIPHLCQAQEAPPIYEIERLRASLHIGAETFLFGVFGFLRESKRLAAILRTFERVRRECRAALLIAGEFASTDLARSLEPGLKQEGVVRIGYLEERDFALYAAAVDACINLRHPAAGETSGIAIRLMGFGKPTILTAGCETSRIPEGASLRIESGPAEEEMLREVMIWLARYPADAKAIGLRAARHIQEHHSLERAAELYWESLKACYHEA